MSTVHAVLPDGVDDPRRPSGGNVYDRRVLDALGLAPTEKLAGFIHIGRAREIPSDRPRPALDEIVTFL